MLCYTERALLQGEELPEVDYSKVMAIIEAGRGTTPLSYFEFGTLGALQLFSVLDVVILEVRLVDG
nr:hypothetical protein [Candidatus Doolittlea endobia]